MNENSVDLEIVKKWYSQLFKDFAEVDNTYTSWKAKRDDLVTKLNVLRPVLINAGISAEDLEQTTRSATQSETEGMEAKSWADLIHETLQSQGRPMHYGEILKTLKDRGYTVTGKDPRNTVLAYLSRHKKRFTKAPESGRGYYKLKE